MKLSEFIPLRPRSGRTSLLATVAIPAGEAIEITAELERFDLNEYLTTGCDGVFFTIVSGDSMEAEIFHGDLLIVNPICSRSPVIRLLPASAHPTRSKSIRPARMVFGWLRQMKNTPHDL